MPPRASASSPQMKFSSVDRVVFPQPGYTKGDVIAFYLRVAPKLLPHLRDRPVTLERLPEGVKEGAPHFWQKNTPTYYPKWIARAKLPTEKGTTVEYVLVNDEQTLAYLVNQNIWGLGGATTQRVHAALFEPGVIAGVEVTWIVSNAHKAPWRLS